MICTDIFAFTIKCTHAEVKNKSMYMRKYNHFERTKKSYTHAEDISLVLALYISIPTKRSKSYNEFHGSE